MATIAELEAKLDTVLRQLEEADQARVKAERLADKLKTEALQARGDAERATIESHLRAAALAAGSTSEPTEGSKTGPLEDVVRAAMSQAEWKISSEGKLYRLGDDGEPVMTAGGYETPLGWMSQYRQKWDRLFPKHQGGNGAATGIATGSAASTVNHWSRQHWNLTKQSEYIAQNGSDAGARMAAEAGSSLDAIHPPAK